MESPGVKTQRGLKGQMGERLWRNGRMQEERE